MKGQGHPKSKANQKISAVENEKRVKKMMIEKPSMNFESNTQNK